MSNGDAADLELFAEFALRRDLRAGQPFAGGDPVFDYGFQLLVQRQWTVFSKHGSFTD